MCNIYDVVLRDFCVQAVETAEPAKVQYSFKVIHQQQREQRWDRNNCSLWADELQMHWAQQRQKRLLQQQQSVAEPNEDTWKTYVQSGNASAEINQASTDWDGLGADAEPWISALWGAKMRKQPRSRAVIRQRPAADEVAVMQLDDSLMDTESRCAVWQVLWEWLNLDCVSHWWLWW